MVLTAKSFPLPPVCFKVFDVDRDGVLSRTELKDMVVALLEVWKDNRTDKIPVSAAWGLIPFCFLSHPSKGGMCILFGWGSLRYRLP